MTQTLIRKYNSSAYGVESYGNGSYGGDELFDLAQSARGNRSRKSEQWDTCTRCGFTYPLSQLRLQTGDGGTAIVCTVVPCFDQPSRNDLRPDQLPQEKPFLFVDENGPNE